MDEWKADIPCQGSPELGDRHEATVVVPCGAHVMGLVWESFAETRAAILLYRA